MGPFTGSFTGPVRNRGIRDIAAEPRALGRSSRQLRADWLLDEARHSGGDPLRLSCLFGISDPTAIRYCAELEVEHNGPEGR